MMVLYRLGLLGWCVMMKDFLVSVCRVMFLCLFCLVSGWLIGNVVIMFFISMVLMVRLLEFFMGECMKVRFRCLVCSVLISLLVLFFFIVMVIFGVLVWKV